MIKTNSARETRAIGEKLASCLRPGDVILLQGDLGAGKSEFARGIARGLGINGPIPSPSFTILNEYDEGRLPLYHFDWYRIEDPMEIAEMGMNEQLLGSGVAVIEWGEKAEAFLPERLLAVDIRKTNNENSREISFHSRGGFPFQEGMIR